VLKVPALSVAEMVELDRRLVEDFHFDLSMLMENAGRSLARQAQFKLGPSVGKKVLVMTGEGNNGGGGLVAARHLHNWGYRVEVALSAFENELKELPLKQVNVLRAMGVPIVPARVEIDMGGFDLIIDSLLGYGQRGNPREGVAELVRSANASRKRVLCLDVPTGLDPDSGNPYSPCIKGAWTLTLAFPKRGLLQEGAKPYVGELFLADIGVPRSVYRSLGVKEPIFSDGYIVGLDATPSYR